MTTPNSKRYPKSLSAIARDRRRINSYVLSQNNASFNEQCLNDTHPESPVSRETQSNENDDANECRDNNHVEVPIIVKDTEVDVDNRNSKSDINDDNVESCCAEKATNESTSSVESDHVEEECINDQEVKYKKNIKNKTRNQKFIKMVHDTRAGESKVYGHTDDLIFSVDEHKFKYSVWAIHDSDKESAEIYSLLKKWPYADPKRCKYGVDTLHKMLPDIVKNQQQQLGII